MRRPIHAYAFVAAALALATICRPLDAQESIPAMSQADAQAEESLLAALDTNVDLELNEARLGDGLAEIGRQIGAPVHIDRQKLEEASVSIDQPVKFSSRQIGARSVLALLLRPLELHWVIKDRVVLITTKEEADQTMIVRVYPVLDLTGGGGDYQSLFDVITSTISPTTWDEVGGPGSIAEFRAGGALVLSQTREIHDEVARLLTALRVARDRQGLPAAWQAASMPDLLIPDLSAHGQGMFAVSSNDPSPASRQPEVPRYSFSSGAGWQLPRTHE